MTDAPAADGERDFIGPTRVLGDGQRIEFLQALATTAPRFFDDPKR